MSNEFLLNDYIKMQNDMYLKGLAGSTHAGVICYGDDGERIKLNVWYDDIDYPIVERCMSNLFIKAYSKNGREGVNTQTSPTINFEDFGYGKDSTAALRRLIALHANEWTLQFLEDSGWDIFPMNDNHLDLRRDNLVVAKVDSYYFEDVRTEMSLSVARMSVNV